MTEPLDEVFLRSWVGRQSSAEDVITPRLLQGFRATLDQEPGAPQPGDIAPAGLHWCLAPPTVAMGEIGPDGHPARGGFLPPVPLPRRMWAGGRLSFHGPLKVGDLVRRDSTILSVTVKQGRTGPLCFVVVEHRCSGPNGLAITEEHDIVYRGLEAPASGVAKSDPMPEPTISVPVTPSPVSLFRYSALTFNGHRIHYDRDYCRQVEGYPGLIVHGPLQATFLMDVITRARPDRDIQHFSFRATKPLYDTGAFTVNALDIDQTTTRAWIASDQGTHMDAQAMWR